jgi:hypothetical protein
MGNLQQSVPGCDLSYSSGRAKRVYNPQHEFVVPFSNPVHSAPRLGVAVSCFAGCWNLAYTVPPMAKDGLVRSHGRVPHIFRGRPRPFSEYSVD